MSYIGCKALRIVINLLSSGPFDWVPILFLLRMVLSIMQSGLLRFLSLSEDFCNRIWFREVFSFISGTFFFFFFHLCFFDVFRLQYSFILIIFLLSKSFLIWQFYSFCCFSFPTFHNQPSIFFHDKLHFCKLAVYSYCFSLISPVLFHFFKQIPCNPRD